LKIYVDLPDELVAAWCPVEEIHIEGDVYQIVEVNNDPEGHEVGVQHGR
jgi:hypothetical protein